MNWQFFRDDSLSSKASRIIKISVTASFLSLFSACQTYQYAQNVKMIGFDENSNKGTGVGPIRGEDCVWMVLGYWLGGMPTLDKAFSDARTKGGTLRYLTNVASTTDGFNAAGIVGKSCVIVKGSGFK